MDHHLKKAHCAIALGSNLGNSRQTLEQAINKLEQIPEISVNKVSHWYETLPVGPVQPNYFNGCALLTTTLLPLELLDNLLSIENHFGRVRRESWGARTLDLDLLLYDDLVLETPRLELPHPRMRERAFVLVPLAEIASDWIEPITESAIAQLKDAIDCSSVLKKL
ncbi:2-amino-4-hydroxy-6-hydroxymethyldihydropteridine diphosphokinase [Euhalothece natronophila Z-M001]|uniref:2-amino-4-hydroxy-6-hydroxymethyldihydropteridine diphosphokinase n=1 Tax=Euhalothece natronophila Z-M001 TaxID=522448 RepID=A0A5B8NR24_9CHRO|nr:2-amino-4-hydroxy-6-hydroxymethyldihydropteridine diphosphokinase [Euhalothece natronophila]QDZ41534.1 2-amino-4-hydroxy-6-hydroxymethyldihydropteridine diphosphokinase [Euhalothece natronophila Z-M001]